MVWPDQEDDAEHTEEMARLKYEWTEREEKQIAERLEGTRIDDPASLFSVLGQPRVGLVSVHVLCIFSRLRVSFWRVI